MEPNMTFWQFLSEAGFWQWIGMICLAAALAGWRPIVIKRCNCKKTKEI
jgi:hypothetical protein